MNTDKKIKNYFYYECARCLYRTDHRTSMNKHLKIKKICENKTNCNLTGNLFESLCFKKKINKDFIENNNIENKSDKNNTLINLNNNINENNTAENKCMYCNKNNESFKNLQKHIIICNKNPEVIEKKIKNIEIQNIISEQYINILKNNKNQNIIDKKDTINNINEINNNLNNEKINITNNTINNNYIENQQNNLIINLSNENDNNDIEKILIPFFDKFDTSHIKDDVRLNLLLSHLYYDTLKEILKNKVNLNFLLDKNSNQSFIYKNENENIVKIDNVIIYNNVWKKVRDYLLESLENIKKNCPKYDKNGLNYFENQIIQKYNEFIKDNNKSYSNGVIQTINTVFEEKRNETEKIFKLINNNMIENE